MKLLEIDIRGFGKLVDKQLKFGAHTNVIYGHNEAGKSTIHAFLRAMFYGFERERGRAADTDAYSRYSPWNSDAYGGSIVVSYKDHNYRITRDFLKSSKDLTIVDSDTGESVPDESSLLNNMLCQLSETAYMNTVSIGQLRSATDTDMIGELKNYITNMNTTGNNSIEIATTSAYLNGRRQMFSSQIVPEAAKSYAADLSEIKSIETELSSPTFINRLRSLQQGRQSVQNQRSSLTSSKKELTTKQAADKQLLKDNNFTSNDDIEALRKVAHDSFNKYKTADEKAHSKPFDYLNIGMFILVILTLVITFYVWLFKDKNILGQFFGVDYVSFFYYCWFFSIMCFIADFIILSMNNRRVRRWKNSSKELITILSNQLGDAQISDAAISALDSRLNSFAAIFNSCTDRETRISDISKQLKKLEKQKVQNDIDLDAQNSIQSELEEMLSRLSQLRDDVSNLENIIAENKRLQFEIDAIDLAQDTIDELSGDIKGSFGVYLNKKASDLVASITGGVYSSLSIDEDLAIYISTESKLIPIEHVSSGTMDQIYLALRLAYANLMQSSGEKLPLVFDDSFVSYDEYRLSTALKWLVTSYEGQIIIFTCHRRESQILSNSKTGFTLIEL